MSVRRREDGGRGEVKRWTAVGGQRWGRGQRVHLSGGCIHRKLISSSSSGHIPFLCGVKVRIRGAGGVFVCEGQVEETAMFWVKL